MKRNHHLEGLQKNYLFPEINQRKKAFLEQNPAASLISLAIGDTTEPLSASITEELIAASKKLGTPSGYSGYGPEQGMKKLREKIASVIYGDKIKPEEIFISDGAKCDIGRLQLLFGKSISIAVQSPSYPVYIEGSLIHGVQNIAAMECTPENHFFPNLEILQKTDLIYFCSPNNPTGVAANREQLESLIQFAASHDSIIIFDAAYSSFIQNPALPKSIYEIPGAKKVAIEINSFSKLAGFTGIRLGWSVVPESLKYEDGGSIQADWLRLISTIFNGASSISQYGGCAVLTNEGLHEIAQMTRYYQTNAKILKEAFEKLGYEVFGGIDAPYLWIRFKGLQSWDIFQKFLEEMQILVTPGIGFGKEGEEFIRITAFNPREKILEAVERIDLLRN